MPTFMVTSPDGRKFKVDAPEGATQEQAIAYAQQRFSDNQTAPLQSSAETSASSQRVPGSIEQGVKDALGGAIQSLVRFGAWVAPNSQFAKDAQRDMPLLDRTIADGAARYEAARAQNGGTGIDWGRAAGNVIGSTPFALGGGAAKTVLGRVGSGALTGARVSALTTPVTDTPDGYAAEKVRQALGGAVVGGALPVAGAALRTATNGIANEAARRLADAGVQLTPGQILGGVARKVEDQLSSIPLVGDLVLNRQIDSFGSFNRAAYNRALSPIGQTADNIPAGSDAVAAVRNKIGEVYEAATPQAAFAPDKPFMTQFQGIRNTLAQTAPSRLGQFDSIADQQLFQKLNGPTMSGPQWSNSRSMVGSIQRNHTIGNTTADDRALADALGELNDAMSQSVARTSPANVAADIGKANSAWAQYKQIERAAGSAGAVNNGNVFTPAQFSAAVRAGSTNGQRATNSGLNGEFASDAAQVLGNKYPDSGTAGRLILGTLLAGGGTTGMALGAISPQTLLLGAPLLAYTRPGRSALQTLLIGNRPGFIAGPGSLAAQLLEQQSGLLASPVAGQVGDGMTRY